MTRTTRMMRMRCSNLSHPSPTRTTNQWMSPTKWHPQQHQPQWGILLYQPPPATTTTITLNHHRNPHVFRRSRFDRAPPEQPPPCSYPRRPQPPQRHRRPWKDCRNRRNIIKKTRPSWNKSWNNTNNNNHNHNHSKEDCIVGPIREDPGCVFHPSRPPPRPCDPNRRLPEKQQQQQHRHQRRQVPPKLP